MQGLFLRFPTAIGPLCAYLIEDSCDAFFQLAQSVEFLEDNIQNDTPKRF